MKRTTLSAGLTIIIIVLAFGIYWAYTVHRGGTLFSSNSVIKDSGSNISDYSAVFLTNGQVYFGKIYGRTDTQIDLRNIYYLQVNQQVQPDPSAKATPTPSASESPQVSLVKLGNELHGPNDRMIINMTQVLFTESLKSDSKVVTAIQNFTSK